MALFKTSPEKAAALVSKLQGQYDEMAKEVGRLKAEHQQIVLSEMEGEFSDSKANRSKLQKALQAARLELTDLADALTAAKSRHAVALAQAEQEKKDRNIAESDLCLQEAQAISEQLDVAVPEMAAKFTKMVDLMRKAFALAPPKNIFLTESPVGEPAITRAFRLTLRKAGFKWGFSQYFDSPDTIKPLVDQVSGARQWLQSMQKAENNLNALAIPANAQQDTKGIPAGEYFEDTNA